MKKGKFEIINSYLEGSCSIEERKLVEYWLEVEDKEAVSIFDKGAMDLNGSSTLVEADLRGVWKNIDKQTKVDEPKWKILFQSPLKIAAVVTVLLVSFFVFESLDIEDSKIKSNGVSSIIKKTNRGENLTARLPDGTKVRLNSSSSIEYVDNFLVSERREVILTGEAFFDVKKDEYRPFVIKTGKVSTTVLGTSFNVDSRDNDEIKVAVLSGKVEVKNRNERVVITPGEMAVANGQIWKTNYTYDETIGWKDGLLVLRANKFEDVVDDLERWYGVDIEIEGVIKEKGIDLSYLNESLEEVLEGLSFAAHFDYAINGKKVKIKVN
ncbi:MAG: FecR domain-containing protein [Cyclobacteriaceae bacterium]